MARQPGPLIKVSVPRGFLVRCFVNLTGGVVHQTRLPRVGQNPAKCDVFAVIPEMHGIP